ncbi:MAG: polysaccharide deacetylase family protein [Saprospiraceae bacterium]|nr:polysaccharide deacetylase family protein [Saprospiraceae bacterium]
MITVHIPNNFIPERTYAVRTLLTHYCGIPVEVVVDQHSSQYELKWEDKSIVIADAFFGKIPEGQTYADAVNIPKQIIEASSVGFDNIPILFGKEQLEITRERIVCHVDLFAGVFFMLTRWEESLGKHKDLHDRFPASEALVVKQAGYILRPIVDEYSFLLRTWLLAIGYSIPEQSSKYKIVLSCDVDIPYYWRSKPLWKNLGGRLLKHWNIISTVHDYKSFRSVKALNDKDPYDTYDYLMDLAEKGGNKMQFNFIGGGKTKYEGYYQIDEPHIKTLIKHIISRGHHIGVHPSYDSYMDGLMIRREKEAVASSTGISVVRSRQHYLRFSVPETWQKLSAAGIIEDSTLGYAAEPGFRCGTCKPFPVFEIHQREQLPLTERPLLIMDVSFRMYKNLSIEESIKLSEKIKEQVKKHNGELVVLWHNSNLSVLDGWGDWKEVLEKIIN